MLFRKRPWPGISHFSYTLASLFSMLQKTCIKQHKIFDFIVHFILILVGINKNVWSGVRGHTRALRIIIQAHSLKWMSAHIVTRCCRAIGPFNASEDLPIDYEDALLVWMNKVSTACVKHERTARQQRLDHNNSPTTVSWPSTSYS